MNNNKSRRKSSLSSRKMTTKKAKRSLPKFVSMNTAGTYRVRKETSNNRIDVTFKKLKDAKAFIELNGWK